MSPPYSFDQLFELLQVFRKQFQSLPVMAISWIYCTNARDPVHQKLLRNDSIPRFSIIFLRIGWVVLKSFQWFSIVGYLHWRFRKEMRGLSSISVDGVAKTWVYPKRNAGGSQDFYYGKLQENLEDKKFCLFMLCGNPTKRDWALFIKHVKQGRKRLPDFCLISPLRVFQMGLFQIAVSLRLLWIYVFERDAWMRRLLRQVSCDCLRSQTLLNGLHFWVGKKAAALWRPRIFLTLYEGYAWEKCLWKGVRATAPSCKIVGYQHTVILSRALELRRPCSLQKEGLPDIVLCSGIRTLQMIKLNHEKQKVKLLPFGSFRFPSEGIQLKQPKPSFSRVLVLPEGILSEAILLFNVAIATAVQLKEYSFVLRLHPILSVENVTPFLKEGLENLNNVHFSQAKRIEDDFASCSALLYRASSAPLYGILNGLKPFYWRQGAEENIDSLFELETFRKEVVSIEDLVEELDQYRKMSSETILPDWQAAAKYVQEYTIPVDEKSIQNLMEAIQS